jgi:hypothetical protein
MLDTDAVARIDWPFTTRQSLIGMTTATDA